MVVKLQCKNKWLLVSFIFPYNELQDNIVIPFFFRTSCVRHALLGVYHVKHFTLFGAKFLHTFPHKLCWLLVCWLVSIVHALLIVKAPCALCNYLNESGSLLVPGMPLFHLESLATLSTSQSFRNLLKERFHPCGVQQSLIFASGLLHSMRKFGKESFKWIGLFQTSPQNFVLLPSPTFMYKLVSNSRHKFLIVLQTPTP